jgi:hypothetical protein
MKMLFSTAPCQAAKIKPPPSFVNIMALKTVISDFVPEFDAFIDSDMKNGLVYAPTQVGKSEAIIRFIENSFKGDSPVIVSTDNKNDQCSQLYDRITSRLCGAGDAVMRVSDKRFGEHFKDIVKSGKKKFVIFVKNPNRNQYSVNQFILYAN